MGYDAFTMKRLAEAADVSTKTLYNLYGSRDELLVAAIEELLEELQENAKIQSAREGVERLMALCEVSAQQVVSTPQYSEVLARALLHAEKDHRLSKLLLGDTYQRAEEAFLISQKCGEITPDANIKSLAKIFTSHQWGLILTWSKGLISLEEFPQIALQSQLTTVLPVSRGKLKKILKTMAKDANIPT